MTTGSSPARGLGIAPAAGGLLGLFLGSFVAARLTQSTSTPDEAAIRLFAAFFLLFGLLFSDCCSSAMRSAGFEREPACARDSGRCPPVWPLASSPASLLRFITPGQPHGRCSSGWCCS
jgi:hypothetical protein